MMLTQSRSFEVDHDHQFHNLLITRRKFVNHGTWHAGVVVYLING